MRGLAKLLKTRVRRVSQLRFQPRIPATYTHDRPPTHDHTRVMQVAAECEKDDDLVLCTTRATCTSFLVGCHGARSSNRCPACGVSCQVVSTYHSITPTQMVTYFVWVKRGVCIGSWWGNRRERDHWGDLGVGGLIILGWISRR